MRRAGADVHAHARPIRLWRLYTAMGASLLLVTAAAYYLNSNIVQDKEWLRFQSRTQQIQHDSEMRMQTYIALLQASAGLFAASETVNQETFRAFVERFNPRHYYPGIQGIGFSRRIRPADKAALVTTRQQ